MKILQRAVSLRRIYGGSTEIDQLSYYSEGAPARDLAGVVDNEKILSVSVHHSYILACALFRAQSLEGFA